MNTGKRERRSGVAFTDMAKESTRKTSFSLGAAAREVGVLKTRASVDEDYADVNRRAQSSKVLVERCQSSWI